MAKPILYMASMCPPARSVMLTAREIDLDLEYKPISLQNGEHLTPEYIKMNPQHTLPTLVDGDNVIYDSHAICCYLVDKYAKDDQLYPQDIFKRAQVNSRLHFNSGHLFARFRFLVEPILSFGSPDCPIDKISYIQKCYEIMEQFLKDHPYLCGDELTIADFCCIATITSIDEVAPIDEFKFPKVLAWMTRLSELPYYRETNEEGAKEFIRILKTKLAANRGAN